MKICKKEGKVHIDLTNHIILLPKGEPVGAVLNLKDFGDDEFPVFSGGTFQAFQTQKGLREKIKTIWKIVKYCWNQFEN